MDLYGWAGRVLRVDLTKKKILKKPTEEYDIKNFVGGRGVNAKIFYDEVSPHAGPYDPENLLIFGAGPLTGTPVPGSGRMSITSIFPMTGFYGDSNFAGYFTREVKYAGYDHIVISGRSEKPVYLWIENDTVEIRDASHIWGCMNSEVEEIIRRDAGDPEVCIASIGPAGEKLVRFANIMTGLKGSAKGVGAVMGSKRLKAIAVRGTKPIQIAKPEEFLRLREEVQDILVNKNPFFESMCNLPPKGVGGLNVGGLDDYELFDYSCFKNFQWTHWEQFPRHFRRSIAEKWGTKMVGCVGCVTPCFSYIKHPELTKGLRVGCAPTFDWTTKILNRDPKLLLECIELSNEYGLDSTSTSAVIALLMELYEKKIITSKDVDGIIPEWGSRDAIISLIHKIANRDGIGDLLAEGSLRTAEKFGKEAVKCVVQIRGLDQWPFDGRVSLGMALGSAVGIRGDMTRVVGADNLDLEYLAGCIDEKIVPKEKLYAEVKEILGHEKAWVSDAYEAKPLCVKNCETLVAIADVLGICKYIELWVWQFSFAFQKANMDTKLFSAVTGLEVNKEYLINVGNRVVTLERAIDARRGRRREHDTLPYRWLEEPIPTGMHKGKVVDRQKFEKMKDEYYELRGYDVKTGIPTRKTLEELGLKNVADDLETEIRHKSNKMKTNT
jgi:aldehyde:ferredoxin oxidoreductase